MVLVTFSSSRTVASLAFLCDDLCTRVAMQAVDVLCCEMRWCGRATERRWWAHTEAEKRLSVAVSRHTVAVLRHSVMTLTWSVTLGWYLRPSYFRIGPLGTASRVESRGAGGFPIQIGGGFLYNTYPDVSCMYPACILHVF
jgi:hypothetical protein